MTIDKMNIAIPSRQTSFLWRFYRVSFLLIFLLTSCKKAILLNFSEIRQAPNFTQMNKFVETSSFHAARLPNIYFIFFDTLRPDLALLEGDGFKEFFDRNFSFKNAYGSGPATWYSTFSLFHAVPGFLAYKTIPTNLEDKNEYGSVFIKTLQKLGYKTNVYGYGWNCVSEESTEGSKWERFLVSFFGWKTRLLDHCHTHPEFDESFAQNDDHATVQLLEKKLPSVVTSNTGNFSILTFYNNHTPYRWESLTTGASADIGKKADRANDAHTRNRYLNSVKASNINFKRVLKLIETLPGNNEAIIVLFSDHGEMLYEKNNESEHGGIPYKEKIKILLSFQLGKHFHLNNHTNDSSLASITDVFPTLFDYLEITPEVPQQWITGQSLISTVRKSVLMVQTNQEKPTRDMVLENNDRKAWITIDEDDFYHSTAFKIHDTTNSDDKSLAQNEHFCFEKSDEECKSSVLSAFPEAMADLYPSLNTLVSRKNSVKKAPDRLPAQAKPHSIKTQKSLRIRH